MIVEAICKAGSFQAPSTISAAANETRSANGALAVEKKVASRREGALDSRALIGCDALAPGTDATSGGLAIKVMVDD